MNTRNDTLQDSVGWRAPLLFSLAGLLLFGLAYSLLGASLGRVAFPYQATGSLVERDGRVIGSRLVTQPFADPRYFHSRPSAAGYDPMAAAGSNLARSNPALRARIDATIAEVAAREGIDLEDVPADLVTMSGGGLDPHISPAGARVQVARVARERGLDPAVVEALVERHIEPGSWGLTGAPRVNVLELNLVLDAMATGAGAQ